MEKRFETRKREIEQDAKIDKKDLAGAAQRLDQFLVPFFVELPRSETRKNALMFVQGLLSDLQRKNVESIAYRFGQNRYNFQRFIGEAVWDHQVILDRIAQQAAKLYGEDDGILVFDPSAFKKDGKQSVGVARQWLGRFGKVDNGQVGTFMAYVTRKEHALVNAKLFIPQEWNDDPARCERAHIPEEEYRKHKTRHQHCLEMLDQQGKFLPHQWIAGDDELGKSSSFRQELRKRNEQYVLAVPCNTTVCDWKIVLKYKGYEALPPESFDRVDEWKDCIKQSEWFVINVRDGEKRPLVIRLVKYRVMAHTESGKSGSGEAELLIIVERPDGNGLKYDYYLSNALDASFEELARVILGSHRVEDCFCRAKGECGLADYEVRTWLGWHHHVTLSLLATFFLTKETLRAKKKSVVDSSDLWSCVG
jgi:SRSO17 transposase